MLSTLEETTLREKCWCILNDVEVYYYDYLSNKRSEFVWRVC